VRMCAIGPKADHQPILSRLTRRMTQETVSNIGITDEGEIVIALESGGKPSYQHVYRAAAGVYWDPDRRAFRFATKQDGLYAKWFAHIINVFHDEMGLKLRLAKVVTWTGVSDEVRDELLILID
jgi:hypothetical protein